ncbi:MAG: DsbA family protein [Stenomitos rutilans HA7619-LM2]|jgi:protein-disulfide isomerase|nr:DsbA family protein [Stenomitos rutilans HA7619-LM2]
MKPTSDRTLLMPAIAERDHRQGALNAAIVLVEYGDYQCPYCAQAYPIVQALQRQLGDRLCFVFRHFPLNEMHPQAQKAAEAAKAAAAQGKFWEMHDCLFAHQAALTDAKLFECAIEIGLEVSQFLQNVTGNVHAAQIQAEIESGINSGVTTTPTFFINGVRHQSSWDLRSLLDAIAQIVSE